MQMADHETFFGQVIAALKVAAVCIGIGIAFLLGAMVVAIFLPPWLFVTLTAIAP